MKRPATEIPYALANFDKLPDTANVRAKVVELLNDSSRQTIYRRVKAGTFPPPIKTNTRQNVWNVGALRAFMRGAA